MSNDAVNEDAVTAARNTYRQLLAAWNDRNAQAFASLFEADAVMIGYDGTSADGSAEIGEHLGSIFENHPTATYLAHISNVREVDEHLVLLRAQAGMVPPGEKHLDRSVNALHTVLIRHGSDNPSIILFQNTPAHYHGRQDLSDDHVQVLKEQITSGVLLS